MTDDTRAELDTEATSDLLSAVAEITSDDSLTSFESRLRLARLLGARFDPDSGLTSFGFWAPGLAEARIAASDVRLELFTADEPVDFTADRQALTVTRERVPLVADGDYWWGVVRGVRAGTADRIGALYWLIAEGPDGREVTVRDLVADSIPFGSFAPAEVYDLVGLQRRRRDLDHFATEPTAPTSILELHIPTATTGGTVADLAETYQRIGDRLRRGEPLSAADQVYVGYDAIQPLPVDPTIERPEPTPTFSVIDVVDEMAGKVGVLLRQPENKNWGYDNVVASSSATNPSLLRTKRPDELVALAEALHGLPEPMMLIYDLVYGHADNQALDLLPSRFFKGPNMYGQDLNHQDPTVRAILLEMQRRRVNTGCDGLRVDGAQDFKFYDPRTGQLGYDDDYLQSMSEVPQEIGEHTRRLWMIFEDGRPWPDEGWETSSTYRDVIDVQPDVYQWGPLIFAHNTPMLEGFWSDKWWRVEQIIEHGGNWISGCANHDTVRRGTQVDPLRPLNRHLGDHLPTILDNAYDNDAVLAVSYALLPGIPMDFLNATTRTPWGFMRTTDDVYGVKVMCEEAGFLSWQLDDETWKRPETMWRTKRYGFAERDALTSFLVRLGELVDATDYHLDRMAAEIERPDELPPGPAGLQGLAFDFMSDMHELSNVGPSLAGLDADRVAYAHDLRLLRRAEPWLGGDCRSGDVVEKVEEGQVVYRGHRTAPDGATVVATIANMAGPAGEFDLDPFVPRPLSDADTTLVSAGAELVDGRVRLSDGSAAVFVWTGLR